MQAWVAVSNSFKEQSLIHSALWLCTTLWHHSVTICLSGSGCKHCFVWRSFRLLSHRPVFIQNILLYWYGSFYWAWNFYFNKIFLTQIICEIFVCANSQRLQPYSPLDSRKGTLLLNNVFAIVAAVILTLGERAKSFEMLIIGRLVIGVDSGKTQWIDGTDLLWSEPEK